MKTRLDIRCPDPDWCGSWKKSDVEDEMRELLDREPSENEWLSWVFDHAFSDTDLDADALVKVLVWSGGTVVMRSPRDGSLVEVTLR